MTTGTAYPWSTGTASGSYPANISTAPVKIPIPKKEDVLAAALKNMSACLDDYKKSAESFWTFGALKMEQQFQVNGETQTADQNAHFSRTFKTTCPLDGKLTLVHCFQATRFVPIPNTKYSVQELNDNPLGQTSVGKAITGKLDKNGTATLTLKPGKTYKVVFYPDVSKQDVDTLLHSYDAIQQQLIQWLQQQWDQSLKLQWQSFETLSESTQQQLIQQSFSQGVFKALLDVWDDVTNLYDLIAHPLENTKKAIKTTLELDYQAIYEASKSGLNTGLSMAQDEALLFLFAYTLVNWIRLLPPNKQGEIIGDVAATMLLDILIGILLTGGVGLAVKYSSKAYATLKDASLIKKSIQELISLAAKLSPPHIKKAEKLIQQGENTLSDSQKAAVIIGKGKEPSKTLKNASVNARKAEQKTIISTESKPVTHSSAGETDSGKAVESAQCTATDKCPVSMVTGEELLTLEDGHLAGIFPFTFQRLYRSSAAEKNLGMGYGWSHTLAHLLTFANGKVFWRDHEGRTIAFPEPTQTSPGIINPLAGAAIWLGRRKDEIILTQPGQPLFHFTRHQQHARLTSLTDRYQNRLLVHYNDQGELRRIELPGVHALQFYYVRGLLQRIDRCVSDPNTPERQWQQHQLIRYHYNELQQLIAAENAAGECEHYRYNDQHVIQERQLAGGVQFFWEWENEGKLSRCTRHWSPQAGFDSHYQWDDAGGVAITEIDGSTRAYQHNGSGKLISQTDPDGAVTTKTYDADGNLLKETDPLGSETQYDYHNGQLSTMISADGQTTEYQYWEGFVRKITKGNAIWRYERNAQGDITAQTTPEDITTRYRYSDTGQLTAILYADGSHHQLTYNRFGLLISELLPAGEERHYRYDALGRLIVEQNEQGAVTQYQYDELDRVIAVVLPQGQQRRYSYNAYGKVTTFTDEKGNTTRYEYGNQLHLVTAQHNPDGSVLRFAYNNPKLFLSDITNERGEQYQLRYYSNGLVASEIDFAGRKTGYVYDLNGKLTEKQEFSSTDDTVLVTRFVRDVMGRLVKKILPDRSEISYQYDPSGNLVAVSDGHWPLHYEYDHANRLIAEHQGFATSRFAYNALGQLEKNKLPDGNVLSYHYARGGLLSRIELNEQLLTRHHYTQGLESRRDTGLLQTLFQYDEQGRLTEQRLKLARPAPFAFTAQRRYHYDELGNLSKLEDSHKGTREFFYDPLERLTQVRGAVEEFFSHDAAGNLLSQFAKKTQAAETTGNRLQFQGDRHFEYDGFGNLIAEKRGKGQQLVTRYQYDCQHRLIKLEKYDGTIAEYKYDAFGRRIEKQVSHLQAEPDDLNSNVVPLIQAAPSKTVTEKTTFLWQANRLIAETNHQDCYRSFVYEPGTYKPLAQLEGKGKKAEVYYYHLDHLGTPQELTNTNGKLVWAVQYRAYGNVVRTIANEIEAPLRFQGQYFDAESGLHYNRHRYYQPETGRFLTPDPIRLAGGLNNYQYVPNPVNWVDPLGLANKKCGDDNKNYDQQESEGNVPPALQESVISETSRRRAIRKAQQHAQVPRESKGGQVINHNDLNIESRGINHAQNQADGAKNLGRLDPYSKAYYMDHPDGHHHQIGPNFPEHHSKPHVHAVNSKGLKLIITYKK